MMPQIIWIRIVQIRTISMIFTRGKVAMKCAALLNGAGLSLSNKKFIIRWTGKKVRRNSPASAITNFLEIEENRILLIVYRMFKVYLFKKDKEDYQK
jgi:hypothetical protein